MWNMVGSGDVLHEDIDVGNQGYVVAADAAAAADVLLDVRGNAADGHPCWWTAHHGVVTLGRLLTTTGLPSSCAVVSSVVDVACS